MAVICMNGRETDLGFKQFAPLRDYIKLYAVQGPWQSNPTEEEDYQYKVRECRREINHLQLKTTIQLFFILLVVCLKHNCCCCYGNI